MGQVLMEPRAEKNVHAGHELGRRTPGYSKHTGADTMVSGTHDRLASYRG